MSEASAEGRLMSLLRLPERPEPPAGDDASLRVFRAAPGYYHYRLVVWGLGQLAALLSLVAGVVFLAYGVVPRVPVPEVALALRIGEVLALLAYGVQLAVTGAIVQLDYRLRWYMVTDRSLRVREGIVMLREKTLTFANVQQVSIEQGPLQRLLGISDVRVRTAGGGSGAHGGQQYATETAHEAYLRGVSDAPEIRDLIREGVRRHRGAGLGDADEHEALPATAADAGDGETLEAARELLAEVRALRAEAAPAGATPGRV